MIRTLPLLALVAALATAAVAWAAPARTIELSPSATSATWDGSGVTGVLVDVATDDTLLKLATGGSITVSLAEFGPTGEEDLDVEIFKSDASGEPQGEALIQGEEVGEETVTLKNLAAGDYLVRAYAFLGVEATYKGSVKFTPTAAAPAPAATPAPTTAPGAPAAPAAADAPPEARITKLARASKARRFKGFSGTAADDRGVARVEIAIVRKQGRKCTQLKGRRFVRLAKCGAPTAFAAAKGTTRWSYKPRARLKRGAYTAFARAVDSAGQRQGGYGKANKRAFRLR